MSPELFLKLSALNLSTEQMAGVLKVFQEGDEGRKEGARARWRKWKDGQTNVCKREPTLANADKRLVRADDAPDLENKQTNKQENKKERATRLPKDWQIPEPWVDEAVAAGLSHSLALSEARKMHNWSLSSKNGAKLDWLAVWRNWLQGALENQTKQTGPPKPLTLATMWREEARNHGILDDTSSQPDRRLEARFTSGDNSTPGFARRIASTGGG